MVTAPQSWKRIKSSYLEALEAPWYKILMEIQNTISYYTPMFYESRRIKTLHLPITTGTISSPMGLGSDSLPVKVNLCNVDTYLADSMQFMLEYGCRIFEEGCYYIMPSFRGEDADERHLCQFYHSEAEIIGGLDDVMELVESYIVFLSEKLIETQSNNIIKVTNDLSHIEKMINLKGKFPRITLHDAVKLLDKKCTNDVKKTYYIHEEGFPVLTSYGEKKLIELFDGCVWLTNFDHLSLPFYQAFADKDKKIALNADLLFGIGETVGCGERHKDYVDVLDALDRHNVDINEYEWYVKMKEVKPLQTAGFGMGIERFILWLLQHNDIRDCQMLPRFNGVICMP